MRKGVINTLLWNKISMGT